MKEQIENLMKKTGDN